MGFQNSLLHSGPVSRVALAEMRDLTVDDLPGTPCIAAAMLWNSRWR